MRPLQHFLTSLMGWACLACHLEPPVVEPEATVSAPVLAAVTPLLPDEHARVAAALAVLCPPSITPYPPQAWQGNEIEVDYESGDRLTDRDVVQILHVGAEAGVSEPLRILVRRGKATDVRLLISAEEDSEACMRIEEWLLITHPNWQPDLPQVDQLIDGGWELARPSRVTYRHSYFRDGDALWAFRLDSALDYAGVLDLYRMLGEGEMPVEEGVELPKGALAFLPGSLGTVMHVEDERSRKGIRYTPSDDERRWDWELRIAHSTGYWSGCVMYLAQRNGVWTIVGGSEWIH